MNRKALAIACLAAPLMLGGTSCYARESASVSNGRYLVKITGCNDCHTRGYGQAEGNVREQEWLEGDNLGWNGPWGTTYPPNLRLLAGSMNEETWMKSVKNTRARPPMPWYSLRDMRYRDFRDIYRYLRHLGPAGEQAPAYVPPGRQPNGAYVRYPQ